MSKRYNQIVLTVIAAALLAIVFQNTQTPKLTPAAQAADSPHNALWVPGTTEGFNALKNTLTDGGQVVAISSGAIGNTPGLWVIYKK